MHVHFNTESKLDTKRSKCSLLDIFQLWSYQPVLMNVFLFAYRILLPSTDERGVLFAHGIL